MDVAELAEALKDQSLQPAAHTKLMQRMQELMGQGMDISSLFANIVSSASTRVILIKKAAYAFLARYGRTNEELCFLSINTLHQDCADLDPIVRSLALRTLCSLGQRSVLRFMLQPLSKGFQDKNAHVRKTAVMACISLFELDPAFVLESELVDKLYGMLRDRDAQVAVSVIVVLESILMDEGGIVINHNIATHLLRRYKDWNAGQLQVVLGALCRYKPQTSDEIYEIMNDVDDGLQHSSLAVQMATLRLFIWLCQDLTEIQEDVQRTIEETLIKHLDSPVQDLVHASLCHLALMVETTGKLQHNSIQHLSMLLCRPSDQIAIRLQKLELCAMIASQSSATSPAATVFILDHLCQVAAMQDLALQQKINTRSQMLDKHVMMAHLEVACRAIESIGTIGSRSYVQQDNAQGAREVTKSCIDRLFQLLTLFSSMDYVLEDKRSGDRKKDGSAKSREKAVQTDSWMLGSVAELNLDDSQLAHVLSAILMAIECCWQRELDNRQQHGEETPGKAGINGGVFEAFQIKILGILLLRHLDQGELDRLAKKKKPLRFRYDDTSGHELAHTIHQQSGGDISRVARISGLRMLLLEESAQQLSLRLQIRQIKPVEEDFSGGQEHGKKAEAIQAVLEMRTEYAMLLQQQIQDMVQSVDIVAITASKSNGAYRRAETEHISLLNLACHLVAFSIEHEDKDQSNEIAHLRRRLDILAQAVDQLIPASLSGPTKLRRDGGQDLLDLDTSLADETPVVEYGSDGDSRVETVSRDVADRAQLIEAFFLMPLLQYASSSTLPSSSTTFSTELAAPRVMSRKNPFDSPIFRTEAYQQIVKQKIVAQFGVQGRTSQSTAARAGSSSSGSEVDTAWREEQYQYSAGNLDRLLFNDWLFQVAFNTLAVIR